MFFPPDVWRYIFNYLDTKDRVSLFQTCNYLKRLLLLRLKQEKFRICGTELYIAKPDNPSLLSSIRILKERNNVLNGIYTLRSSLVVNISGSYFIIGEYAIFLNSVYAELYRGTLFECVRGSLQIRSTLLAKTYSHGAMPISVSHGGSVTIGQRYILNRIKKPEILERDSHHLLGSEGPRGPTSNSHIGVIKPTKSQHREYKRILKYNSNRTYQK
jgi:hypothetical protein